jgi:glycosyltransferase involved in cell wall biosynthesis
MPGLVAEEPALHAERSAVEHPAARLRVCMLAETFHPVIGGCESQARLLAEQLTERGHQVMIVTRRTSSGLPASDRLGGVRILRVGPGGPGGFKRWPMVLTALTTLFRMRREFDVVLVLGFRSLGLSAGILRRWGKGCVLKAESNGEMSGDFFAPRLERLRLGVASLPVRALIGRRNRVLTRADAFIAISAAVEAELRSAGIPEAKITRIPNAVDSLVVRPADVEEKGQLRARLGFGAGDVLVTFTGRLVSYKGLPLLLRVWERVVADVPSARLVLVGAGGQDIHNCEDELRAFVRDRSMDDRVVFTGDVSNVHEYLQASDVFIFPTENEAFGISLIEAMSCGLPVVAASTGGITDIVEHGVDGILVPPGDDVATEAALRALLSDPEKATGLGVAARRTVKHRYSVDSVVDSYETLLRGCSKR